MVNKFGYEITFYPAEEWRNIVYFCTSQGECEPDTSLESQLDRLQGLLNRKGAEGWELVQVLPGAAGMVAVWKRASEEESG